MTLWPSVPPNLSQGESALREGEVAGAVLGPKMWSRGKTHNIDQYSGTKGTCKGSKGPRGHDGTQFGTVQVHAK